MSINNGNSWRRVKRFRREMFDLAVSFRDDAPALVKRVYARKARVYHPYVAPQALSKAKNGGGGPFGQLPMWLAALEPDELAIMRAEVDGIFDAIEAEKLARELCADAAMLRQQEADALEDIAEKRADQTGCYREWLDYATDAIATTRHAIVAIRRRMIAGAV